MSEPPISPLAPPADPADTLDHEHLAALADEFIARYRRGERPTVDEYARRYPHLAGEIRDVFPAMLAMEQPVDDIGIDPVGTIIGRYKLLERIGEGGFGVVYMAEQRHPVRRTVALKVINPGLMTFSATWRRTGSCCSARKTIPNPPSPMRSSSL